MSTERYEVAFAAETSEEAVAKAKAWAKAEGMTLRTVASCRPGLGQMWTVTLVVRR